MVTNAADTDGISPDRRTERAYKQQMNVVDVDVETTHAVVHVANHSSSKGLSHNAVMVNPHTVQPVGCGCEDTAFRDPEGGCKHERYVSGLLGVVRSLLDADYVGEPEILTMVDSSEEEAARIVRIVREFAGEDG